MHGVKMTFDVNERRKKSLTFAGTIEHLSKSENIDWQNAHNIQSHSYLLYTVCIGTL